jgi:transcriptional regulator with XRE-family HTH domain
MHEQNREVLRSILGRDLAELRGARGWSQQQLADRLGVTREAISGFENGRSLPDIRRLPALLDLLVTQ